MSDGWAEIVRTPPTVCGDWIALPENGWGAIVAYRVGPGRARPHHAPIELRQVTEICTDADGTTRRRTVAMSADDFADIAEAVNTYLADVGLPPTPFTWWEVAPPDGMTGEEFVNRLEAACSERVTAASGVEVAQRYAAVLPRRSGRSSLGPPRQAERSPGSRTLKPLVGMGSMPFPVMPRGAGRC